MKEKTFLTIVVIVILIVVFFGYLYLKNGLSSAALEIPMPSR
ncbi:MAG TPA: hypothetical protein VMX18_00535 [Candidatus Bipolaricaulota bacterium]|nr:hypothetical protein [Candidatus Bipolaricaulota bacterium]